MRARDQPVLLISLPYWKCQHLIRRAVDSILGQTFKDFTLVVVNDADPVGPWEALADIKDSRLIRFDLAENHGRYYADSVVLAAAKTDWFTVHDADDWSASTRLETLWAHRDGMEAVTDGWIRHHLSGKVSRITPLERPGLKMGIGLQHIAHQRGLWQVDGLRRIGGMHPAFRTSWDTGLMHFAYRFLNVATVGAQLYHQEKRKDGLTASLASGTGTEGRIETQRRILDMYRRADRGEDLAEIVAWPTDLRAGIEIDAARLARLL